MRSRRLKVSGSDAVYHCMTRTVNGELLFGDREKEVLRKMLWRVADFCGVEVLAYCVMDNHFHVLVSVAESGEVTDAELMRRYRVLYPKPTKYQAASAEVIMSELKKGGQAAEAVRRRLLARMGDVSEYMKAVKQRFSVWYNRTHGRYGTLWAERFKSVLVEGRGNALQTMAAYIDLNSVRAGLVEDPKDYRFCGYAEATAGLVPARKGLLRIWSAYAGGSARGGLTPEEALREHRMLLFGKAASQALRPMARKTALKVLEQENGRLPRAAVLRCRVRYFTDGAVLGSKDFVKSHVTAWRRERSRRKPPRPSPLRGADWGDLAVIRGLRKNVFG